MKAMRGLQVLYPNMLHVTCFSHGLHRLCEFIRDKFKEVNALISTVKMVYVKVRILMFFSIQGCECDKCSIFIGTS